MAASFMSRRHALVQRRVVGVRRRASAPQSARAAAARRPRTFSTSPFRARAGPPSSAAAADQLAVHARAAACTAPSARSPRPTTPGADEVRVRASRSSFAQQSPAPALPHSAAATSRRCARPSARRRRPRRRRAQSRSTTGSVRPAASDEGRVAGALPPPVGFAPCFSRSSHGGDVARARERRRVRPSAPSARDPRAAPRAAGFLAGAPPSDAAPDAAPGVTSF